MTCKHGHAIKKRGQFYIDDFDICACIVCFAKT